MYNELLGHCPFLYGLIMAGNRIKMLGAFEMSITVFNALANIFKYEPVTMSHDQNSSKAKLQNNITLLKELIKCCTEVLQNNSNCDKIYSKVESLWIGLYKSFVDSQTKTPIVETVSMITDNNYKSVLLHMCTQMCWYNRIALSRANGSLVKDQTEQLKQFANKHLPNALTRAELKEHMFKQFQGVDLSKNNHYPSKILVTANLHSPKDEMTKGLGVIANRREMINLAKLSSYLMQTAMQCMLREVQLDIDKKNEENINNDDKLQIVIGKQVMNPGQYSKFRLYQTKELSRTKRSLVEQVTVTVPIRITLQYKKKKTKSYNVRKFIVKTYYNDAVKFAAEDNTMSLTEGVEGFPRLYNANEMTGSLVMQYVGESCKGRNFTISELIQMCQRVNFLHEELRVHNDLKESNFTFRSREEQQAEEELVDKEKKQAATIFLIDFESVTKLGRVSTVATSGYKAPERFVDQFQSYCESDIYSLGIIFANNVSFTINCVIWFKIIQWFFFNSAVFETKITNSG